MTCNADAIAGRLGIQRCHVRANELLDLADSGDRDGYRIYLDRLADDYGWKYRDLVNSHAKRQYKVQRADYRYFSWRVSWKQAQKKGA